jgi:hypothetical protein
LYFTKLFLKRSVPLAPNLVQATPTDSVLSPLFMEPSRCSVLVVDRSCTEHTYQPSQTSNSVNSRSSNPFLANSGDRCTCEANNNQDIDDLIKIFLNIFAEGIVKKKINLF